MKITSAELLKQAQQAIAAETLVCIRHTSDIGFILTAVHVTQTQILRAHFSSEQMRDLAITVCGEVYEIDPEQTENMLAHPKATSWGWIAAVTHVAPDVAVDSISPFRDRLNEWTEICRNFHTKVTPVKLSVDNLVVLYANDVTETELLRAFVDLDSVRGTVINIGGIECSMPIERSKATKETLRFGIAGVVREVIREDREKPE